MNPGGCGRGLEGRQPLREQAERETGQHVARPGCGEVGRRVGVDRDASVGRRDRRVGALQQHHRPRLRRRLPRPCRLVAHGLEQAGELTLVRGQDRGRPADRLEQGLRLVGEDGQGVGVQHSGLSDSESAERDFPRFFRDPRARPHQRAAASRILKILRERFRAVGGDRQRADETRGVDGPGLGWAQDAHHAGAYPHRRAGGEPGSAGHLAPAGDDGVATAVFVIARSRPAESGRPQPGFVCEGGGTDFVQHGNGDTDIGDMDIAHGKSTRIKKMSGFPTKESNRKSGLRRGAPDLARIAVDTARHVHGDAKPVADRLDRRARLAVHLADQAGAENRVDDKLRVPDRLRRHGLDRAGPARNIDRRVSLQPVAVAQQRDPDRPTASFEQPGDHEPVAAVIAWATEHRRRPARPSDADPVSHGPPRRLHQVDPGRAAGDGERIRAGHLLDGQQFGGHRASPRGGQAAVSLRSLRDSSSSTSWSVITSAYLWCRSNSAILWISSARSNTHSSTTVAW